MLRSKLPSSSFSVAKTLISIHPCYGQRSRIANIDVSALLFQYIHVTVKERLSLTGYDWGNISIHPCYGQSVRFVGEKLLFIRFQYIHVTVKEFFFCHIRPQCGDFNTSMLRSKTGSGEKVLLNIEFQYIHVTVKGYCRPGWASVFVISIHPCYGQSWEERMSSTAHQRFQYIHVTVKAGSWAVCRCCSSSFQYIHVTVKG